MSTPLRVLVAGCGNMGASHARAYHKMPDFDIVGLVSRGPASRAALGKELGGLPEFSDYIGLSNLLNPDYLTPLIREDAWRRPLAAYRLGSNSVRLVSAGPDGKLGSSDDIEVRVEGSR